MIFSPSCLCQQTIVGHSLKCGTIIAAI